MLSVPLLFVLPAFVCCVASAAGKVPLWISVILLVLVHLLELLPV